MGHIKHAHDLLTGQSKIVEALKAAQLLQAIEVR